MATKLQAWNRAAFAAGETQPIQSLDDTSLPAVLLATYSDDALRELLEKRPWQFAKMQAKISEVTSRTASFTGDGATTQYTIPYENGDASQVAVTVDGVALELGIGWTYTAPTNGYDGLATLVVAPAGGAAIAITVDSSRNGWEHVYALPANYVSPVALVAEGERVSLLMDPRERVAFAILPNNSGTGFLLCTDEEDFDSLEYIGVPQQWTTLPANFVQALVCRMAAMLLQAIPKDEGRARAMMQNYFVAFNDAVMVDNAQAGQPDYQESAALACR